MFTPITNCSKQVTIRSKVRESATDYVALYEITEVEFDQYRLKLLERNSLAPAGLVEVKLNCQQLLKFGFEVEQK